MGAAPMMNRRMFDNKRNKMNPNNDCNCYIVGNDFEYGESLFDSLDEAIYWDPLYPAIPNMMNQNNNNFMGNPKWGGNGNLPMNYGMQYPPPINKVSPPGQYFNQNLNNQINNPISFPTNPVSNINPMTNINPVTNINPMININQMNNLNPMTIAVYYDLDESRKCY